MTLNAAWLQLEALIPNPEAAGRDMKLLWISCGNNDELIYLSRQLYACLELKLFIFDVRSMAGTIGRYGKAVYTIFHN